MNLLILRKWCGFEKPSLRKHLFLLEERGETHAFAGYDKPNHYYFV